MSLIVKYDAEVDALTIRTGHVIQTSSSIEDDELLIVDFGKEDGFDVVGFELLGAANLLAPFLEKMRQRATAG
jgi:uncharacterized protein YuzE